MAQLSKVLKVVCWAGTVSVSVVVGATSSTLWVEPHFQAALLPLGNGGTQEGPPLQGRTGEPRGLAGERAGRTWQQTPQSPTVAPKDLESDFITPRKRGKRRLSSDSSNSEGESLDSRTPLKMTRVGEDVMADTATTPPASPTDTIIPAATSGHDNVGKKSPQPADKPKTTPTVQEDNPAPKLRQDYPPRKAGKRDNNSEASPTATRAGSNSSRVPGHRHSWTSRW